MTTQPYVDDTDWPANYGGCRFQGQYVDFMARPVQGRITVTPSPSVLLDAAAKKILVSTSLEFPLAADGSVDFVLPASDDPDLNPSGWTYMINEVFVGLAGRSYPVLAPLGQTVNLVDVAPVVASLGNAIVRGPAGPEGPPGSGATVADNGITTAKLADAAVTNPKVATGISADKMVDGTTNHVFTAADDTRFATMATGATANSTDAQLRDRSTHTGTIASTAVSDFAEASMDTIAAFIKAGSNVTVTHDDAANTFTINAVGGGTGTVDVEGVRDAIGGTLVAGSGIQVLVDDPGDTVTILVSGLTIAMISGLQAQLDAAVKLTGNQTIAGVKTFSSAPAVPDNSWTISDTSGLQTALDDGAVVRWSGTAWGARPANAPFGIIWLSTNDANAPAPSAGILGDIWRRHPDAAAV